MDTSNRNTALASAFVEELARSGMTRAVISPGSRSTPLAVALWRQADVEVAVALDERSASFMALGAATATRSPVALLCTSGTAAANFHPAVAEADLSSVPLVVLTADRPPELRDNGSGQTIDQIKLFGSSVRWYCEVGTNEADDVGLIHMRSTACRAFAAATGDPRPGPVHLNLPWREPLAPITIEGQVIATEDLALNGRGKKPLTRISTGCLHADTEVVEELVKTINAAERPMIIAGRQTDASLATTIIELADELDAPVLAEPTSQLRFGSHDRTSVITGYEEICRSAGPELTPDLIIRFGEMPTSKQLRIWLSQLGSEVTQAVVDPCHAWNEPTRRATQIIRADAGILAGEITRWIDGKIDPEWVEAWTGANRAAIELTTGESGSSEPLSGPLVHRSIAATYAEGDIVYTASSMSIRDQEANLGTGEAEVLFLANRGANGIDGLIASGIGAAWSTSRPTTVITGDLGFQHDVGSLALLDQTDVPVRIVVVNDGGGAIFSHLPQKVAMPEDEFEKIMTAPGHLDIKTAALAFGISHQMVSSASELSDGLASDGQSIVEVIVPAT